MGCATQLIKGIFEGHSFVYKTNDNDENELNLKGGSWMKVAIGLRGWLVLRVRSLSPAGESMESSLTFVI